MLFFYKTILATGICIATEIQTTELVMADSSKGSGGIMISQVLHFNLHGKPFEVIHNDSYKWPGNYWITAEYFVGNVN